MREPLVQVGVFAPELQARIDQQYQCLLPEQVLNDPALRSRVRGVITRSNYRVDQALLDALPALRVIATCGVGYDGIPVAWAQQRGIVVTHTPGVLDAAVCELAIGLLLGLLRDVPQMDRHVRSGAWQQGAYPLTTSLAGLRIGIVGLGRIGKGIAARLAPFGVALAYTGSTPQPVPYTFIDNVTGLAEAVDVLVLSCEGGAKTHHLINAAVLHALGAGWLVNVARGSVVDEAALVHALTQGRLRGAALDVFADEPLGDSPLRTLPNVLLSPHAGSGTAQTRSAMLQLTLDNLQAVLAGSEALTPVPARPR